MTAAPAPDLFRTPPVAPSPRGEAPRVLVACGDRRRRDDMIALARGWGYSVEGAPGSAEAMRATRAARIDIVLADWTLGARSGVALCRALRALGEAYVYVVLIAPREGAGRIAEGLNAGADDVLVRPVAEGELAARLAAGARLLSAQRALAAAHAETGRALAEARRLAERVDRDLEDARRLQASLMPPAHARVRGIGLSTRLRMSGQVGGDLLGWSTDEDGGLSIFAVDVSGHGIASALMAARLKGVLMGEPGPVAGAGRMSRQPHCVASRLNELSRREISTDHYFTMLLAHLEPRIGRLRFVQAGHPRPLLLRARGDAAFLGEGGLPVGLMEGARWKRQEATLRPGDRLLLCSDGVTECEGRSGMLGEEGLLRLARPLRRMSGPDMLDGLVRGLREHAGGDEFGDDVSMLLLDVPPA